MNRMSLHIGIDLELEYYIYAVVISPASSNPFFAAITAMISLMTAAAAMVPFTMTASSGSETARTEQIIPVKTRDTPEWGNKDRMEPVDQILKLLFWDHIREYGRERYTHQHIV